MAGVGQQSMISGVADWENGGCQPDGEVPDRAFEHARLFNFRQVRVAIDPERHAADITVPARAMR